MTTLFDERLGEGFLATVPTAPGVYHVFDAAGVLVYVGKAVNLRRRLAQYRLATRKKKHRKMRIIVRSAARIVVEPCESALAAELREAALIQSLAPKWNVAGAFSFMYPSIGLGVNARGDAVLACSTAPGERPDLAWHGAYRSREVTRAAFYALGRLLAMVGHRERSPLRKKGERTRLVTLRRMPAGWDAPWSAFLRGESRGALTALATGLLEKARARKDAKAVQADLVALGDFYEREAQRLAEARRRAGDPRWPIPQEDRDALFIRARRA